MQSATIFLDFFDVLDIRYNSFLQYRLLDTSRTSIPLI